MHCVDKDGFFDKKESIVDPRFWPNPINSLVGPRRTGKTPRILDNMVQALHKGYYVEIVDHKKIDGKYLDDIKYKEELFLKLKKRFENEHINEFKKLYIFKDIVSGEIYLKIEGITPPMIENTKEESILKLGDIVCHKTNKEVKFVVIEEKGDQLTLRNVNNNGEYNTFCFLKIEVEKA